MRAKKLGKVLGCKVIGKRVIVLAARTESNSCTRTRRRTRRMPAAKTTKTAKTGKPGQPVPRRKHHHNVYVIELSPEVLQSRRFRDANPNYDATKPCVYVGSTGLEPEERFAKQKAGVRANRYVERYGLRLLPRLYAYANPMPYMAARDMEVEIAIALREQGYGVWQA